MHNILISSVGFGEASPTSLNRIASLGNVSNNVEKIRFNDALFLEKIVDQDVLILGTEKINKEILDRANKLRLIARIGVGLDNIDLKAAFQKGISICYTPDAPSLSVPEFTLSLILNLIKGISLSDRHMHQHTWHRPMGRMLSFMTIGIVGAGKIGSQVINLVHNLAPTTKILFYDTFSEHPYAEKRELAELFKSSDIVSLHLPLNKQTTNLINQGLLQQMRPGSFLINTSRGGIVDESALYFLLKSRYLGGAAVDVFAAEPYKGKLCELENCLLTSHLGSMSQEVRALMEEQITEDIVRFLNNQPLLRPVPKTYK